MDREVDLWPSVVWRPGVPRPSNHTFSGNEWLFGFGAPGLQTNTWPTQTLRDPFDVEWSQCSVPGLVLTGISTWP